MIHTTCKDMGGPCDATISGTTPEEVMAAGGKHVMDTDDDAHKAIAESMKTMTPEESDAWAAHEKARLETLPHHEEGDSTKEVEMM